jgi:hypothetical protein
MHTLQQNLFENSQHFAYTRKPPINNHQITPGNKQVLRKIKPGSSTTIKTILGNLIDFRLRRRKTSSFFMHAEEFLWVLVKAENTKWRHKNFHLER